MVRCWRQTVCKQNTRLQLHVVIVMLEKVLMAPAFGKVEGDREIVLAEYSTCGQVLIRRH